MDKTMTRLAATLLMVLMTGSATFLSGAVPARGDTAGPTPPPPTRASRRGGLFPFQGGEAIYQGVCQGCHMPDAKGAVGAGAYPALAKNENLETAAYPVTIVLKGQKAMPPLGANFSDQQIADVVNYVRTHFGNKYRDKVKPEDVKLQRE
jgi:mono/diheme cytochrome c family protein